MFRTRTAEFLLVAAVLVGVSTFALARMGPGEERSIPYQGFIEQDGAAVTGTLTARFGLFSSATANTSCVLTNNCPLWSEEQVISVVNGRFGVVLGDGTGPTSLSDAVLGQPALFLAVAFQGQGDAAFTLLGGTQEIVPAPLAARAANVDARFAVTARPGGPGQEYQIVRQVPAGWGGFLGAGRFDNLAFFPSSVPGVSGYICTASAATRGVIASVEHIAGSVFFRVPMVDRAGTPVDSDVSIVCEAF